ncbi:MAG TPA: efflux RND transporter periplasmic adaptor subunit [Spirochaetota bacterium]
MKSVHIKSFGAVIIILAVIAAITFGWLVFKPGHLLLEGQVEATQVKVSSKLTGRLLNLYVREGQQVSKGEVLVLINSPELEAKYEQALAARKAATAQRKKAMGGAREEEIRGARDLWLKAKAGSELAEKTFERAARLYKEGVIPQQKYDEAESQLNMAKKTEDAAKASFDMAQSGARLEDKESAQALLEQASGMVSEVQAYLRETRLIAPINGEVVDVLAEQGELVAQGFPIITIVDLTDTWITFNVRENLLSGLKLGDTVTAMFPALDKRMIRFKVNYISALGDFATWRATRSSGDFDLRTFEVRAVPLESVSDLRPGMSAIVDWDDVVAEIKSQRQKSKGR